MRFIKVLLLTLIVVLTVLFLYQNKAVFDQVIVLNLDLHKFKWQSPEMPIYVPTLGALLFGTIISILYFLGDSIRKGGKVRTLQSRVNRLENELAAKDREIEALRPAPAVETEPVQEEAAE